VARTAEIRSKAPSLLRNVSTSWYQAGSSRRTTPCQDKEVLTMAHIQKRGSGTWRARYRAGRSRTLEDLQKTSGRGALLGNC
jgi:hypothetical protein